MRSKYLGHIDRRETYLADLDTLRRGHTIESYKVTRKVTGGGHRLGWEVEIVAIVDDPHDGIVTRTYIIEEVTTDVLHEFVDFVDHHEWVAH